MSTARPKERFTDDIAPLRSRLPSLVVHEKRGRIGCLILLPTVILVLLSAGLATFLLLWLTVIHGVPAGSDTISATVLKTGVFLVDEGTSLTNDESVKARLLGLTITTVTVRVESFSEYGLWLKCS